MSVPFADREPSATLDATHTFSVVTGRAIARFVDDHLAECVDVVRAAYVAHANDRDVTPPSVFLKFRDKPNARIIALPSHLEDAPPISGIKWIASYPDNVRNGVPRASAVLVLNRHDDGYPFACLEGSIISAARTAASAVLAAQHLNGGVRRAHTLGIVGSGFIARYVYRFLTGTGWDIANVRVYDRNTERAERFAEDVCEREKHLSVAATSSLASAVRESDLVLFTTIAAKPFVHERALFEHHPIVLHLSLRDLAPELLLEARNIVDDVDHVMRADTSLHLALKLTGSRDFVAGTLVDVMEGRCTIDRSRTTVFSPFGLGVLDLAVGRWVYDGVVAAGEQCVIPEFFFDLQT